jgi:hypothetical protein
MKLGGFLGFALSLVFIMRALNKAILMISPGSVVAIAWVMAGVVLVAGVALGSVGRVSLSLPRGLSAFCYVYVPGCLAAAVIYLIGDQAGRSPAFFVSAIAGIAAYLICRRLSAPAEAKSDLHAIEAIDPAAVVAARDRLTQCARCGLQRSASSTECPHCGHDQNMSS